MWRLLTVCARSVAAAGCVEGVRGRKSALRNVGVLALGAAVAMPAVQASVTQQATTVVPGTTSVGATAPATAVTVVLQSSGVIAAVNATTQGAAHGDFAVSSGTCGGSTGFNAGDTCTASVVFRPLAPGVRLGAVVLTDANGSVVGHALLAGMATGSLPVLRPGEINTVAGDGTWLYRGDGAAALATSIFLPTAVVEDAAGNVYFSDSNNNRIRRIDALQGTVSTVGGNGTPGFSGEGTAAMQAALNSPAGLVLDGAGDIYFVDSGNSCVRRIDAFSQAITTVAGTCAVQGLSGDGAAATAAKLSLPEGLAMDLAGNLYIADTGNNRVRKVDAQTGLISTVAGGGSNIADGIPATTAALNSPWGLAIGPDGLVYIADLGSNRIRKVDAARMIQTVAGSGAAGNAGDGGAATSALLDAPAAVAFDPAGNLYIGDSGNNTVRGVSATTSVIRTLVGGVSTQFSGDLGPATKASLYGPYGLFVDGQGNLLIADMFHNRLREVYATALSLQFDTIRVSKVSPFVAEGVENIGNADATVSGFPLVNAALNASVTTCAAGVFPVGASCALGVEFAPTVVGNDVFGSVSFASDAANSAAVITIEGKVLTVNPTSVALTSSANPSMVGSAVTLTATVASSDTALGGTIDFLDGATPVCSGVVVNGMSATCTTISLGMGAHNITASYTGDADNASSVSTVLVQTVKQAASVGLTVSPNPVVVTGTITLTASVSVPSGTASGTVTFLDGSTAIGAANVNASGVATFTTAQMSAGTHALTASYGGDAVNAAAVSGAVNEVVNLASTMTTIATSNGTVAVGSSITLTADVSSTNGPVATGSVSFVDGNSVLGTAVLSNGHAVFTTAVLMPGAHSIVANYSGDSDDAASTSAPLAETVQQIGTVTLVSVDINPAQAGGVLTFAAQVQMSAGATADGAISGTVTFSDGAVQMGTATLDATGKATLPTSTLAVGTHNIVARYVGNTNYAASASPAVSEVVRSTGSTAVLSVTGSGLAGKAVSLSATVTSATGTPTGTVTFMDGAVVVATGTLNAQGVATASTTTLGVGTHALSAVYGGDANYNASTSIAVSQTVVLAVPTLALGGPAAAVNAGTAATLTVSLASAGVTPTGALTLREGTSTIATQTVAGVGSFTFNAASLAVGTHTMIASYAGDANNAAASSNAVTVVVQQGSTATALAASKTTQVVGQAVTLTAAVSSPSPGVTGTVSFYDGTTLLGSTAVTGGGASALGSVAGGSNGAALLTTSTLSFGVHTLTAVYSGDANHASSTAPALSERMVQAAQLAVTSTANPAVAGTTLSFAVKASGVAGTAPSGTAVFLDGQTVLGTAVLDAAGTATIAAPAMNVGAHAITVSYSGDDNYAAGTSAVLTQTITGATTQVALSANANPAVFGSVLVLKAAITSNGGVATGSVTFSDGATAIGTGVLDANGVATVTVSTRTPGAHALVASYAGDGKAGASASSVLNVAVKQTTAVAVASSANPAQTLGAVTFTATVTNAGQDVAQGAVTFTDGAAQLGVVNVDGTGVATLTLPQMSAGAHSISANYAGNATNFAAQSGVLNETVQLRSTATAMTATVDPSNEQQVTLIAVERFTGAQTPTGTVTFTNGGAVVGTVPLDAAGVATLVVTVQQAPESLVATYGGDAAYAGSASPVTTVGGEASPQFKFVVNPSAVTLQSKQHSTVTLTLNSVSTFADNMEFGCLGLPVAATCTFSSTQTKLNAGGNVSVQLTIDTGNPLGAGAATTASNRATGETTLWCFLPLSALCCFGLAGRRRRMKMGALLALVVAIGLVSGTTGCGSIQVNGTPAGNYTFQVTARGQGTAIAESQTVTLNVTQ